MKRPHRQSGRPPEAHPYRLRTLARLNQLISSSLDDDQLLRAIAKAAAELMSAPLVSFWTVDEAAETVTVAAFSDDRLAKDFPVKTLGFGQGGVGWVARHRKPLRLSDVHADGRFHALAWASAHKLKSFFAVPVVSGDSLLAVLAMNGRKPFLLSPEDRDLLDLFVAQAVAAIRNARVFAESEARRRSAEALGEVGRALSQTLDLRVVGRRITESVRLLLGVLSAALYQQEPGSETMVLVAESRESEGTVPWEPTLARGEGVIGLAAREHQTVLTSDILADPRVAYSPERRARLERSAYRALLGMPLLAQDRVIGVLVVGHLAGRAFTPTEVALAQSFADQAAVALENARLFSIERATRGQLEALAEIQQEMVSELNRARLLDIIVKRATGFFEADGAIHLVESDGSLAPRAWSEAWDRHDVRVTAGQGVADWSAGTRQGIVVNDYPNWPRAASKFVELGMTRAMGYPLMVRERLLGVMVMSRTGHDARPFDRDEFAVLGRIATKAAIALENAWLYEDAGRRQREAEALAWVAKTLTESLDVQEVGTRIAESVRHLFGASLSRLRLLELDGSFRAIAWSGRTPDDSHPAYSLPAGTGVSAIVVREGRPFRSRDVLDDPSVVISEETRRALQATGERAFLGAPLRVKGKIIGSLTVGDELGRMFTEAEASLLETFADQAAVALENARLYADAERRLRETELMAELSRSVNESLELNVVLPRVAQAIQELCRSDMARVFLRDPVSGAMMLRYWVGAMPDEWQTTPIEPGRGLGGQVLLTGHPMRTDDYAADPRISHDYFHLSSQEGLVAIIAVPMLSQGRVEGLLIAANNTARPFTDQDETILMRLADLALSAIVNAQFFAREKEARAAAEVSERGLRESESRYRGLVEGSIQGIYIHEDSVIRFANAALARIFGYDSAEALVGTPFSRLMAAHEVPRLEGYAAARLRGEPVPSRYEYEGVRKDGRRIWVETAASLAPWEGRAAFLVTVVDITERKRLEGELWQLQKMEAIGRLAGGVAHDFNNLLTVILGRSQLMLRRLGPEDPLRRDIELIEKTCDRAATVTQQLLAFSRKQVLQPKVLDLNDIVRGMEIILRRLIGEHIGLAILLGEDLGRVKADPGQLEQVIMNLAVNARDAMPEGGTLTIETVNVTLEDRGVEGHAGCRPGRYVKLSVTDTGIGMDEKTRAQVFEPFFTTKEIGKGTGLGLAMVYGIVKQSSGYIAVESDPGRGASFEIYLPLLGEAAEPAGRPGAREEIAGGRETILLVEDEDEVRALTRDILRMGGYDVLEAVTVTDAERLGREHAGAIHMLLTDVIMPQMSGRELAARLSGARPSMRVLYMSGYTDDAIGRHGVLDPGIAFLPKPFTAAGLANKVREVLDASP